MNWYMPTIPPIHNPASKLNGQPLPIAWKSPSSHASMAKRPGRTTVSILTRDPIESNNLPCSTWQWRKRGYRRELQWGEWSTVMQGGRCRWCWGRDVSSATFDPRAVTCIALRQRGGEFRWRRKVNSDWHICDDTECNHTLLKMRILAFLPINPCSST